MHQGSIIMCVLTLKNHKYKLLQILTFTKYPYDKVETSISEADEV